MTLEQAKAIVAAADVSTRAKREEFIRALNMVATIRPPVS